MNEGIITSENNIEELCNNEIICFICGGSVFNLSRDLPEQILLECAECGQSYVLEAVEFEDRPVITFLTPTKI